MNTKTFGTRLRDLRQSRNITLRDLANALNISHSALGNYELGNREPNMLTIRNIADYFDVSLDYLFGNTDNPKLISSLDVLYGASFSSERELANLIEVLTESEKQAAISYVKFLIEQRNQNFQNKSTP